MNKIITIAFLLVATFLYSQGRYSIETTNLLESTILNPEFQSRHGYSSNVLYNPRYSMKNDILLKLDQNRLKYYNLVDSILGIKNPLNNLLNRNIMRQFKKVYLSYVYEKPKSNLKYINSKLHDSLFSLNLRDKYMDSLKLKHTNSHVFDSLLKKEMELGWENFNKLFGMSYMSYDIPIFDKKFNYCFLSWSYAAGPYKGKGFKSLFRKLNSQWILIAEEVEWDNENYWKKH